MAWFSEAVSSLKLVCESYRWLTAMKAQTTSAKETKYGF